MVRYRVEKKDARGVSHEMLEQIRIHAVRRVLAGESPEKAMEALGLNRSCIYRWLAIYRESGEEGLRARPIAGRPRKLGSDDEGRLAAIVTEIREGTFAPTAGVWNIASVRDALRDSCDVMLSEKSVERLFVRFGIPPRARDERRSARIFESARVAGLRKKANADGRDFFLYEERDFAETERPARTVCLAVPAQGACLFMLHEGKPRLCALTGFIERMADLLHGENRRGLLAIEEPSGGAPAWMTRHLSRYRATLAVEFIFPEKF